MNSNFKMLLGLCMKAGRVQSGEIACEAAVKNKKAQLIIVAEDASENTKTKFKNSTAFYKVEYIEYGKKAETGSAIGRAERAIIAITDKGFADKLKTLAKD